MMNIWVSWLYNFFLTRRNIYTLFPINEVVLRPLSFDGICYDGLDNSKASYFFSEV
jgi:hypothetical protein